MSQPFHQDFQFQTTPIPQMQGVEGAHWEHLPLASFPPTIDVSIPESFANGLSVALSNITSSFAGLSNTLSTLTQDLQNTACSFNGVIDSLLTAQQMAKDFADANNNCKIYVRPIGLQPAGTITSQSGFMSAVKAALLDAGDGVGEIPKIVPTVVPLDSTAIADALGAGGGAVQKFLEGKNIPSGLLNISTGAGLQPLSNADEIKNGFPAGQFTTKVAGIIKPGVTTIVGTAAGTTTTTGSETRVLLENAPPVDPNTLVGLQLGLTGTNSALNVGTFTITGISDGSATQQAKQGSLLAATGVNQAQQAIGAATAALSKFTVIIDNVKGIPQSNPGGTATINLGNVTISTRDKIQSSLTARGLLAQNQQRYLPVTDLVDILIADGIVGVNPDQLESDRSIAIERISRLVGPSNFRVGGICLVGQAPDLGTLALKVNALAQVMTFLQPLADQLLQTAVQSQSLGADGIGFSPSKIQLTMLDAKKNVGVMDAQSATQKAIQSNVLGFQMPELISLATSQEQPAPNNFNAWRVFAPMDLIPCLSVLGQAEQQFESNVQNAIGNAIGNGLGTLSDLIQQGQASASDAINQMQSKANSINNIVGKMNDLNKKMVDGINALKDQVSKSSMKVDAHLIGPKLDLLSNSDYINAVNACLNDFTDPNRPTFGPPPVTSIFDQQAQLNAALLGISPPARQTKIWFGVLIFIVGNGTQDLGNQMQTMADILSMDSSVINLPAQKKLSLTWKGFKTS